MAEWFAVPAPGVRGYLVKWFLQEPEGSVVAVSQLPALAVVGETIRVRVDQRFKAITCVIEQRDTPPYLLAFQRSPNPFFPLPRLST